MTRRFRRQQTSMKGGQRIDTDFFGYAEETRKDGATKEPAIFPLSSFFFIDRKIIGRFNEFYIHDAGISQIIILFIRKVRIIRYVEMATFVYSISARSYRKSSIKSS